MSRTAMSLSLFMLLFPFPGASQGRASLDEVDALVGQGRILQARQVLEIWWEDRGAEVNRMDRQRSLWLRARLTVDPSMAELDLRRLVLEFPGGAFSDDALLRLAQSADLRGDLRQAYTHFSALLRGYPSSPHVSSAEAWLQERGREAEALGPELPVDTEASPSPPLPGGDGSVAVQLGAFRVLDGARSLAERLRSAGYDPRVVRVGRDGLIRVRIGRFRSRAGAENLLRELEGAGFEATIVRDAQSEERVGGGSSRIRGRQTPVGSGPPPRPPGD
jgi:hypothetical protein